MQYASLSDRMTEINNKHDGDTGTSESPKHILVTGYAGLFIRE